MLRKIIYLFNPVSGTRNKGALLELITEKTTEANIEFELMETNPDGVYHSLRERVEKENITDLVVCGGDGTVSAVAAAMIGRQVRIGIIPMGSGNGLALAAKIPLQPLKALKIIFDGHASLIDGFYINEQFSSMLCGIGFDAQVAEDFARQKTRGLKTYIKVSVLNLFRCKPFLFEIHGASMNYNTEAFFISIANGNQFGNNFTIAPQASLSNGKLDIVIVKKMNKFLLPFSIIAQVAGLNGRQELTDYIPKRNIIYYQTDALTIINKERAPMHIDGDPKQTSTRFDIRVAENTTLLIHPK